MKYIGKNPKIKSFKDFQIMYLPEKPGFLKARVKILSRVKSRLAPEISG
jgi:hypothetical protein